MSELCNNEEHLDSESSCTIGSRCSILKDKEFIKSIEIRNVKKFSHAHITLSDFTLLFGPNDSGKTTILESLSVFSSVLKHVKKDSGIYVPRPMEPSHNPTFWHLHTPPKPLETIITVNKNIIVGPTDKLPLVNEFKYSSSVNIPLLRCDITPSIPANYTYSINTVYIPLPSIDLIKIPSSHEKVQRSVTELWTAIREGKSFAVLYSLLFDIRKSEKYFGELQNALNKVFPGNELLFEIYAEGIEFTIIDKGKEVPFYQKGSGFKSVIATLATIYWVRMNEPSLPLLLLLDEPTAFLHEPEAILFVQVLQSLERVQLVISSHSVNVLMHTELSKVVSFEGSEPSIMSSQLRDELIGLRTR